ncbi:uncharacterized protein PV09_03390 [Verruconis gallopava]|uniref:Uncharacterized protein n=1 Tax=Verruconis gallopava TaxID=253628 RepID=A0A0D1YXX7_9PEZI|nr:uncharacterized protein PV09_03390 [Verruconis gallopava]KIW05507.1 hypothetical protein PV09_03390 [Verruconis gallopava]
MLYIAYILPALAASVLAKSSGNGNNNNNNGGKGSAGGVTVQASRQITSLNQLSIASGQSGGANNAGAQGTTGANGLKQLNNPQLGNLVPNFDATTNKGTFGPFQPVSSALPAATGAPSAGSLDSSTAQAVQAACDNWSFNTAQVSNFLNTGHSLNGTEFNQAANLAYNAEVNELQHMAILMSVIGNSPDVSIANQTLLNGVFQSVVNNLQIMADQGQSTASLIDVINNVRCTQILPSIDTYLAVGASTIGSSATLRTAIRPNACASIVSSASANQFPGNLQAVNVRGNTDQVTSKAPQANPDVGSVSAQFNITQQAASSSGNAAAAKSGKGRNGRRTLHFHA